MTRTATVAGRSGALHPVVAVLAAMDDDGLCALLRLRPDLAQPRPATMAALAELVVQPASAVAAYERLDRSAQQVAETLALLPRPTPVTAVARLIAPGVQPDHLQRSLAVLEAAALAFRDGQDVMVNPGLGSIGGRTGLGPPLAGVLSATRGTELAEMCRRLGLKAGANKGAMVEAIVALVGDPAHVRRLVAAGPPGTVKVAQDAARLPFVEASPYALND